MNNKIYNKLPDWCFDNQSYETVLTNDIDSLIGCTIEQQVNGNNINYFYDFNNVYKIHNKQYETLGIDLAFTYGKCWDNHVTRLNKNSTVNKQSANINSILNVSGDNYFKKYAGSTALLMWSFYDLPLPSTQLGKMVLLSIDSAFLGHYDKRFKDTHNTYLQLLGFDELIDVLNNTNKQDYYDIIKQYKLNENIYIDDNYYLQTKLPLSELSDILELRGQLQLPQQSFSLSQHFKSDYGKVTGRESGNLKKNIISFALTNKKFYKYTIKI